MTDTQGARRLHPRLRVFRNGDRTVNAVRADAAATMACALPALNKAVGVPPAPALAASAPDLPALRGLVEPPTTRKLSRRPKIEDQPQADEAFVNVFVELNPERSDEPADEQAAARRSLDALLESAVADAKRAGLPAAKLPRQGVVSVTVPVSRLSELEAHPSVSFVHPADPLKLDVPASSRASRPASKAIGDARTHGRGEGVLIGFIDVGGFDFSHADFLDDNGTTRFVSIWDQRAGRRPPPTARGFDYGSEIRQEHMNAALAAAKRSGVPPATLLEAQSQMVPGSHGTHVASIAAGRSGVCPKARLAGVLIDVALPEDPMQRRRMTFSDTSRIVHAVEYLLRVAADMKMPLVINISLGTNGGAHDGSSGVSCWLDAYLAAPARAICIAAGNAGQERAQSEGDLGWVMGRIHAQGRVPARGLEVVLEWTVVGDGIEDRSENELEIWYGAQDRFAVAVKPPGPAREWILAGPREFVENHRLASGTTVSVYNELYHPANGANYIAVYLSPNLDPAAFRGIDAGVWKVRLTGDEVRDGRFNAWIERDDPAEVEVAGGRRLYRFPSFFTEASATDSHSISSLACGHRLVAVSNLDDAGQRINASSSQGPTRDGRCKPEIAAPGTDIVAANGFSHPDDPWVSMTGTSMATPHVAGVVALMLAANPALSAAQCAGILLRTARPLPGGSYEWGNDAGYGRIDPAAAVDEARRANERTEVRPRGRR